MPNETATPAPSWNSPTITPHAPATPAQDSPLALMLRARRRSIMGQMAALKTELAEVDKLLSCA